jgi:hypothetical protein
MKILMGSIVLAAATGLGAGEKDSLLDKVQLGENWFGPKRDLEGLKGHVVLLVFWGLK